MIQSINARNRTEGWSDAQTDARMDRSDCSSIDCSTARSIPRLVGRSVLGRLVTRSLAPKLDRSIACTESQLKKSRQVCIPSPKLLFIICSSFVYSLFMLFIVCSLFVHWLCFYSLFRSRFVHYFTNIASIWGSITVYLSNQSLLCRIVLKSIPEHGLTADSWPPWALQMFAKYLYVQNLLF